MNKTEFLNSLRQALSFRVSADQVNEHMRYYEDYINTQTRLGKSEEEVIKSLGDPRLIAKTIGDTQGGGDVQGEPESTQDYRQAGSEGTYGRAPARVGFWNKLPLWAKKLIFIVILILIIAGIATLVSFLLPVILAFCVLGILFEFFRKLH